MYVIFNFVLNAPEFIKVQELINRVFFLKVIFNIYVFFRQSLATKLVIT